MTTVEEDHIQARTDGLLQMLRDAETEFRRSYARVLDVVAELEEQKAGAVSGFGTTTRLLAGAKPRRCNALDSPAVRPVPSAIIRTTADPACDTTPCPATSTVKSFDHALSST